MQNFLFKLTLTLPLFAAGVMHVSPTHAELGGAVTQNAIQIQKQGPVIASVPSLSVYQKKSPSGTQIKEFVNADGIVAAATWQGPTLPDLKQLLGTHFDEFANRPKTAAASHRNAEMHTDDLVVQSHGQMRSFAGRAYLPKLLPSGFNIDQIK